MGSPMKADLAQVLRSLWTRRSLVISKSSGLSVNLPPKYGGRWLSRASSALWLALCSTTLQIGLRTGLVVGVVIKMAVGSPSNRLVELEGLNQFVETKEHSSPQKGV